MACQDILLFHPGKQHAYEVAIALQDQHRLLQFVTGIYDTPDSWFARGAHAASRASGRPWIADLLSKRRHSCLDPTGITSWPGAELLSRTVGLWPLVRAVTGHRSGYRFANWYSDRALATALQRRRFRPAAVYAFLGAARYTFAVCRDLAIRTILDVPIVLSVVDDLAREAAALGLEAEPAVSQAHFRLELDGADHIVAPSSAVARSVRAAGYRGHVSEVPFGVDLGLFRPGINRSGTFKVAYAGRLELRKGLHYLIEAWRDADIPGELVLAGSTPDPTFGRFLRRRYGAGVREVGNLARGELADLLATSDVFVMPSLAEGSALVTYEALASGLPSIVTAEAGSVVRDGIEGFIVPAKSSRLLAERIRLLNDDSTLRRKMAMAARARAEEFSWDIYHRRLVAAIDAALDLKSTVPTAIA